MATHVWVLSVALAATALIDWVAVGRDDHAVKRITRPTFVLLLVGLAWSLGADGAAPAGTTTPVLSRGLAPALVALGLSLVADALLLTATAARYVAGLLVSTIANLAWAWAMLSVDGSRGSIWWVPVALLVLLVLHGAWGRHVVRWSGRQRGVVFLSLLVLMGLVLVAVSLGDWVVLGGCALLLVSELVLGHDRFVLERRSAPVVAAATHELAQVLLVLGLLR